MNEPWTPTTPYGWGLVGMPKPKDYGFRFADEPPESDRPLVFELKTVRPVRDAKCTRSLIGLVEGSDKFGSPPGSVVFESVTVTPERMADDTIRYSLTVQLVCRRPSWNLAKRTGGSFEFMTDANGQPPYVAANLFEQLERLAIDAVSK